MSSFLARYFINFYSRNHVSNLQRHSNNTIYTNFSPQVIHTANMSGMSNVGGRGVYEAGDQRNVKDSEVNEAERYKEGQPHSHLANDSST